MQPSTGSRVYLNVYDLTTQMNSWTYWCGVGVFHAGVEVYGIEYAYGGERVASVSIWHWCMIYLCRVLTSTMTQLQQHITSARLSITPSCVGHSKNAAAPSLYRQLRTVGNSFSAHVG